MKRKVLTDILKDYQELKFIYEYGFPWDDKLTKLLYDKSSQSTRRLALALEDNEVYKVEWGNYQEGAQNSKSDRKIVKKYLDLYEENNKHVSFLSLGFGTAANEILDYLGLDSSEKAVSFMVVDEISWANLKNQLQKKLKIDAPGSGIAFIIPLSSIGGKKTLQFLLESEDYQKKEESTLKNTLHELIVVIAKQGYTDIIMDAARDAGAYGGTVIHAKGTGMELAEKFMHLSLAAEKKLYDASMNTVLEITQGDINVGKTTLYKKYGIDKLLSDANNLRNLPANKIDVTKKSDIISLTADEKFYQTDFISVVGTVSSDKIGAFKGYQLNLNKVPDGTIVIGEDGNEIKDLSNLAAGTKFALRVPVSNVKEDNKELQISVLGSFDTFAANKYVYKGTENAPSQTVTNVKRINNNLSAPLSIQLNYTPTVPNTAMSNSTTLFFIGIILIVVGISGTFLKHISVLGRYKIIYAYSDFGLYAGCWFLLIFYTYRIYVCMGKNFLLAPVIAYILYKLIKKIKEWLESQGITFAG